MCALHPSRGRDFYRSPTWAGFSAKNPSKRSPARPAGEPQGRGLWLTFRSPQPPAYLFIHHQSLPTLVPVLPLLTHIADINTYMVQQIVKFTKDLPLFR